MKRVGILGLASAVLLSGCNFFGGEEDDEANTPDVSEADESLTVVPSVPSEENYYASVLQDGAYVHGQTRGYGLDLGYSRKDLDWLELGLEDIAKERFDPNDYFFQEGTHLSRETVKSWLLRYDEEENPNGLNPPLGDGGDPMEQEKNSPWVLANVLEQNYMNVNDEGDYSTGGVALGLSLYSEYEFSHDGKSDSVPIKAAVQEEKGMEFAETIVNRMREGVDSEEDLSNVPIVVALFSQQPKDSVNAGHFFKVGTFEPGENPHWENINQTHVHFPSPAANEDHRDDADRFAQFRTDVQAFFSNNIGVVGRARYEDNQMVKLNVDVNIQYKGKAEVVALTQYIAGQVEEYYENIPVDVNISALSGSLESIVSYHPDREPFIHIIN
ncbi:CamS family sex pheromone protein [Shouchella clausii]